jgi:hypothetical protein
MPRAARTRGTGVGVSDLRHVDAGHRNLRMKEKVNPSATGGLRYGRRGGPGAAPPQTAARGNRQTRRPQPPPSTRRSAPAAQSPGVATRCCGARGWRGCGAKRWCPPPHPPPPSRTDWTRLVPPPVLNGHAASLHPPVLNGHALSRRAGRLDSPLSVWPAHECRMGSVWSAKESGAGGATSSTLSPALKRSGAACAATSRSYCGPADSQPGAPAQGHAAPRQAAPASDRARPARDCGLATSEAVVAP